MSLCMSQQCLNLCTYLLTSTFKNLRFKYELPNNSILQLCTGGSQTLGPNRGPQQTSKMASN